MQDSSNLRFNAPVLAAGSVIILPALVFFFLRDQTFVHIDAIAHVNKARGLFDNFTPGLKQLGSIWLPLPHLLMAPLAWFDVLWRTGLAGSLLSAAAYVGAGCFLFGIAFRSTGSRMAGWAAFLVFALNPRIIYLSTTPMTEPLTIFFLAGLGYFVISWIQTARWQPLAWAALMAVGGTLTRYEGWAIAAAFIVIVATTAVRRRWESAVLFAGAACTGPLLWMLYNLAYFEDPLMFMFGRGSAKDYAFEHFLRTGQKFATAGSWTDSLWTYFVAAAYSVSPAVMWLAIAGIAISWIFLRKTWRVQAVLFTMAAAPFAFYVHSLYSNTVPILMPGLVKTEPDSIFNVRYGAVMAAALPVYAAVTIYFLLRRTEARPALAIFMLGPLILPDVVPQASRETIHAQFTHNLFYAEGVRNQSFWMPPFLEVADRLKEDIERTGDAASFILTDSRIVHPVVWRTAIPMRRFIHEMNKDRWNENLQAIDPGIRWVITEEGDLLWHAQGRFLRENFDEVSSAKLPSTGRVHLYRRR